MATTRKAALRLALLLFSFIQRPCLAHVKWFLEEGEADLLAQPKPPLFCQPMPENILVVGVGLFLLHLSTLFGMKWVNWSVNTRLAAFALRYEGAINLLMGLFTGFLLVKAAQDYLFIVPNMPIDDRAPEWFALAEACVGWGLMTGLFARGCGVVLLFLLIGSFHIYPALDCLDLVPMYGIAFYFILAGRGKYSLDAVLRISRGYTPQLTEWAYLLLRLATGFGLVILGLDEKLLHPQLALHVLNHTPSLNFMHGFGMGDEMFVLLAGVTEVLVGLIVMVGSFPRLGMLFLVGLFVCSTMVFGEEEFYGHMPYYGVALALLLRGSNYSPLPHALSWLRQLGTRLAVMVPEAVSISRQRQHGK